MFRSKIVPVAMATLIAIGGAGVIHAATKSKGASESQEITAIEQAKTSLPQAVAAAEQQTGGKAVSASLEDRNGVVAYEVEVASGGKLQKVVVNADTGKVTDTTAANGKNEKDGDQDKD